MQKMTINNANVRISEDTLIFDTGEFSHVTLSIDTGVTVQYTLVLLSDGIYDRHIDIATGSTFSGTAIMVTKKSELHITTQVCGDNVTSTLALLALATNASDIRVEGVAKVDKPYRHVSTRVDQTNILLGSETRVRGIPRLEIATDDIE